MSNNTARKNLHLSPVVPSEWTTSQALWRARPVRYIAKSLLRPEREINLWSAAQSGLAARGPAVTSTFKSRNISIGVRINPVVSEKNLPVSF